MVDAAPGAEGLSYDLMLVSIFGSSSICISSLLVLSFFGHGEKRLCICILLCPLSSVHESNGL